LNSVICYEVKTRSPDKRNVNHAWQFYEREKVLEFLHLTVQLTAFSAMP